MEHDVVAFRVVLRKKAARKQAHHSNGKEADWNWFQHKTLSCSEAGSILRQRHHGGAQWKSREIYNFRRTRFFAAPIRAPLLGALRSKVCS